MKKLILASIFGGSLLAQTPPTNIQISQQPLPIVQGVSAIYTGAAGQTTFYYYVVAKYGVGDANVSVAVEVDNINPLGGGSVAISWGAPANPNSYSLKYDVLRSTSAQFPGTCNCLVSGAQAGNTATDSLGALSSYSANAYNPFTPLNLVVDNVNAESVLLRGIVNGIQVIQPFLDSKTAIGPYVWWVKPPSPNSRVIFGTSPSGSTIRSSIRVSNSSDLDNYGFAQLDVNGLVASLNMSNIGNGIAPTSLNINFSGVTICTFSSSGLSGAGCGGAGSGTVTSFSSGGLSPLFTTSVATATTTPALSFSLSNAAQNAVLAGPFMGGAGAPSYRALVASDIPTIGGGTCTLTSGSGTIALNTGSCTGAGYTLSGNLPWSTFVLVSQTGNVTYTFASAALTTIWITSTQDATGTRTISYPMAFGTVPPTNTVAGVTNWINFSWNGTASSELIGGNSQASYLGQVADITCPTGISNLTIAWASTTTGFVKYCNANTGVISQPIIGGDGVVLSNTLTANALTLANAGAHTVLENNTGSSAAPTYSSKGFVSQSTGSSDTITCTTATTSFTAAGIFATTITLPAFPQYAGATQYVDFDTISLSPSSGQTRTFQVLENQGSDVVAYLNTNIGGYNNCSAGLCGNIGRVTFTILTTGSSVTLMTGLAGFLGQDGTANFSSQITNYNSTITSTIKLQFKCGGASTNDSVTLQMMRVIAE